MAKLSSKEALNHLYQKRLQDLSRHLNHQQNKLSRIEAKLSKIKHGINQTNQAMVEIKNQKKTYQKDSSDKNQQKLKQLMNKYKNL